MATTKISNSGLAGIKYQNISADNNYMETIASTLLATTATGVTFSNIPQGYKHLQVRILARDNRAVTFDNLIIQANGDTGSNYSDHFIYGDGASVGSGGSASVPDPRVGTITGSSTTASVFGANIIDILDYTNTNKYKTVRGLTGADADGSGQIVFRSNLWLNTAAITSLTFTPGGGSFVQYSRFSLYGIKG
jgi:hypothetical protein